MSVDPSTNTEAKACCCSCTNGNCLNLTCPCFRRGGYCDGNCRCPVCANNESHSEERLSAVEAILTKDPHEFTKDAWMSPEDYLAMSRFVVLTASIDSEPFQMTPRVTPLSSKFKIPVLKTAITTILAAANEATQGSSPANFEEQLENSAYRELAHALETISSSVSTEQTVQNGD